MNVPNRVVVSLNAYAKCELDLYGFCPVSTFDASLSTLALVARVVWISRGMDWYSETGGSVNLPDGILSTAQLASA